MQQLLTFWLINECARWTCSIATHLALGLPGCSVSGTIRAKACTAHSCVLPLQGCVAVFRYAVKTLLWQMGFEVEVLNMSDSSNSTSMESVDFLNR